MSTIATPRDSLRRLPSGTPTSSARPSIDAPSSHRTPGLASPTPSHSTTVQPATTIPNGNPAKRNNRAALREYYNLRSGAQAPLPSPPRLEVPDSEVPASDLDGADFDADAYVTRVVAQSSLGELLKLYTRVLGEVRALDAEKKALVYDNYSKLIAATETIRKMRATMDPLNPMASTLDPAIAQIYSQASQIREELRQSLPPPDSDEGRKREAAQRQVKTQELAAYVVAVPERLRRLVAAGKMEEARRQWVMPRKLLESWKEKGVGGEDVQTCIDEGDSVLNPASTPGSARVSTDGRP